MPIRPEHRHFYPIDWPQLSAAIRFGRAAGRCEACGRPHGRVIACVDGGAWYDAEASLWRDDRGRLMPQLLKAVFDARDGLWRTGSGKRVRNGPDLRTARLTLPILATCHRKHDTSLNGGRDLAAWCQRCHLLHDRPEHLRRRRMTYLRRRALGDLFLGPYPSL
ncbi:hypothetical protein MPAR168_24035 [Methylorubrum populi]|uniref:HNH endonuclease n=1 Tax=Methylobacterium radiotolerans TaxID=31998 RepID=A0ABU7T5U5_9HYPH|nr:hypothetical protein [Methylobacterium sp. B4]PXW55917.1 hypothetical protein BY998_11738 [Methylobacterium sp. B4]